MADKSIADKLLIKPGTSLWVSDEARRGLLGPLPDGVAASSDPATVATAIVVADDAASLRTLFATNGTALLGSGNLWVLYPKGNKADINRDTLWPIVADFDMRPCAQVAIDNHWSGLRFRPNREGEGRFTGGAN